jgi:hypothetical protein
MPFSNANEQNNFYNYHVRNEKKTEFDADFELLKNCIKEVAHQY